MPVEFTDQADRKKVGQRTLKQLADHGLIVVVERDGQELKLRVNDPAEVARKSPNNAAAGPRRETKFGPGARRSNLTDRQDRFDPEGAPCSGI